MTKLKQSFIRAFWGIYNPDYRITARHQRTVNKIKALLQNTYNQPFITYVFGTDNLKILQDLGINAVLLDKRPFIFEPLTQQFRNKLEVFRLIKDIYDEYVYLDWDCVPTKPLPNDFWDILRSRASFQAPLFRYRNKKCRWRKDNLGVVPNGGSIYLRDTSLVDEFITLYEVYKGDNDEPSYALYTDSVCDGYNLERYKNEFEFPFAKLSRNQVIEHSNDCFFHKLGGG